MEIVRSVRLSEIDPVFFETSYYVVPDRGGEKPYTILFEALKETQHVALARVGMYGREHVVIVRPGEHGILAHTMFYTDEIRFENEFHVDVEGVGAKELELAKTFLDAIEAPFAPEEFKGRLPRRIAGDDRKEDVRSGHCTSSSNAGNDTAGRGYSGGTQEEHRNGPEAACTGDSAGTEDGRTRDGDQGQKAVA